MAVTLKRKRGAVSYREPSSEDDLSVSSDFSQSSTKNRTAPSRRSTRQQRHRKEDEEALSQHTTPEAPDTKPKHESRTNRSRAHPKISYKDLSSNDNDDDDNDVELAVEKTADVRSKPRRRFSAGPSFTSHKKSKGAKGKSRHRASLGAALKPNDQATLEHNVADIPSDGNRPDWSSLPYHVLLQIFVYASHPLHDENMKPTASIHWLVRMSRACSAFTKPALTALYRNPPIFAMRHTRKELVYHLSASPAEGKIDYRVMVKRLELDATQMTALTDATHSADDLGTLVKSLTTLKDIDIFDPIDRPPFRDRLRRLRRWVYPIVLFEALRQTQLRLRSWRWNSNFCDQGPLWIKEIHTDVAFQSLRELTLTKFHPELTGGEDIEGPGPPTTEELLASALAVLPNLRTLSFETCGVVSGRLLPLLPSNLTGLSITNCGELLSDALQAFLSTHGWQLEELVLNHNQALDLSFLVDLKQSCPKLEVLRMNTTYYSSLAMSRDNEPLYATLLGENEVPTWPPSLRVLDMEYLRNWDATSATNFFSSLIDAAGQLPGLQEITIMAIVDTDWRQRAEFRRKWSAKFKQVFARKWELPSPHLASFRAFREYQARVEAGEKNDALIKDVPGAKTSQVKTVETATHSDDDAPLLPLNQKTMTEDSWGSKRLRSRSKAAASYDEASESEAGSDEAASEDEDASFVQGRCHTVMFRVDNFRPREEIYAEADFLDAEPSGDEEWNGNEGNGDEGGYAW